MPIVSRRFAKDKGIKKKKRDRMVFDEVSQLPHILL